MGQAEIPQFVSFYYNCFPWFRFNPKLSSCFQGGRRQGPVASHARRAGINFESLYNVSSGAGN